MMLNLAIVSHPLFPLTDSSAIKNIIFDFGGVICNIDAKLTEQAFRELGFSSFDKKSSVTETSGLFEKFETGSLSPQQFRDAIRTHLHAALTDRQIDTAWNALLLDMPAERISLLETVRKNYRIFLLSNSNQIHYDCYVARFSRQYGYTDFDELFEKAWFSFRIGLKKPHEVIFDYVTEHSNLEPSETLFIDDTLMHVEGALRAGLHAHHLDLSNNQSILHLFH
jgi:putative hydrolase of the HAD superfamily